ncbi:UDP-glucose 4-epimerase GalE [Methanobrevibacter sp. TMH8]|uniref:UDP-glucose 4-epimerase GalE n=1 Tax=Methanobrevibacter sp. TMH8 TaxID=2848611 RepID=UPI001CCF1A72|nr:UDP-glucose 4-epimerase GalE [Methanobrevibacter sp. TMH8]MBZ9571011.1 UDP-glucose 4-epimerase GalE [Methanobrevibacter sp. TMH8]
MILVTGGAGYIGSHVNKELHKEGYDTVVLDNLSYGYEDAIKWGEFVKCDLADTEKVESIFNKYDIEGVMHFAGFISVGESVKFPAKYYKNNYKNTLSLLKVMKNNSINKFIFSSTAAVYGNPYQVPITENHKLNPINPYGKSKLMVELALERESKLGSPEFKYSALRYFNASGADIEGEIGERHNPETHLIPLILDVATEKRDNISIFGDDYDTHDGTCIRDYIHVADLAQAHIKAFEYLDSEKYSIDGENIFNLGNGNGFSVKEVVDICEKVTGIEIKKEILGRRDGDPPILIADSMRAKNTLNWNPQCTDLEKIVESAWNWHKKQN